MTNQIISLISGTAVASSAEQTSANCKPSVGIARHRTTEQMFRIASRLVMLLKPTEQLVACTGVSQDDPSASFAAHAALALARLGRGPVLLVDANFHPKIRPEKPGSHTVGFSDLLSNESNYDAAVQCTEVDGLDVLTAGDTSLLVPSLLSSTRMNMLMSSFRNYRLVIMDVGAITENAESLVMASKADVVLATAASGERTRREVTRLKTEVSSLRVRFLGVVLTDAK
jgi:Mrp family chromosome partitioning ATPase